MAIDTKEKRAAVLGLVTPNSAKDVEWRRQVLGIYSFALGGDTPDVPTDPGVGSYQGLAIGSGIGIGLGM